MEGFVMSSHLVALLDEYAKSDKLDLQSNVDDIREVEQKARNLVAHNIVGMTDKKIKRVIGFSPAEIMTKIKSLFGYAGIGVTPDAWNSYDKMNEEIISLIGTTPDAHR